MPTSGGNADNKSMLMPIQAMTPFNKETEGMSMDIGSKDISVANKYGRRKAYHIKYFSSGPYV